MTTETEWPVAIAKANEVLDRLGEALPVGVRGMWSLADDAYDPWGDTMQHAFALNTVAYVAGWECSPTFGPGAGLFGRTLAEISESEDWPDAEYADLVIAGEITREDAEKAIPLFDTALHALELIGGLDY
jgi:hypothetical protein